ncbi:MAG: ATP-binding cassette domain-containing protein [Rhizobiales bacterium]|nr:ATP-binding cassette domain-containing protein [Hyphomicrobiales bacterium]
MGENVLEVEDLSHSFGKRRALASVSFTIAPGAFTILLGQNGAGKTTLFNLITRLYNSRSGHIRIFGVEMRADPGSALARLGVVFQQRTVDLDLTVRQNLLYHGGLHGLSPAEAKERADRELARFDLAGRAHDRVRELSGGQVRRVEIARALIHSPKLLLLDEPTVGLDIGSRQGILDHVRRLCDDDGLGVLWATHLIDEAKDADGVIVLHQGEVKAIGSPDAVCAQAGADTLRDAFNTLTKSPAAETVPA